MGKPQNRSGGQVGARFELLESRCLMSVSGVGTIPHAAPAVPQTLAAAAAVTHATLAWHAIAPSPILRAEAFGGVANNKVYVFGGYYDTKAGITPQRRCDVYDPATNRWTRLPVDLPEPVADGATVIDGSTIWLIGGFLNNVPGPGSQHVWKFDTRTNTFTRGPDLPAIRGSGSAAIVGRTIHFVGGGADKTSLGTVTDHLTLNLDDPHATWQKKAPLVTGRNHAGAVSLGGLLYVVGGQVGQEWKAVPTKEVDRYDPATDRWTRVGNLPSPRSHIIQSTIAWNGKILVVGGDDLPGDNSWTLLSYDPKVGVWQKFASLPTPRSTAVTGILSGNRLIFTTGNNPSATTDGYITTLP